MWLSCFFRTLAPFVFNWLSGIAADVLHMEKHLGSLSSMPIFILRQGLDAKGVVLPPLVDTIAKDAVQ